MCVWCVLCQKRDWGDYKQILICKYSLHSILYYNGNGKIMTLIDVTFQYNFSGAGKILVERTEWLATDRRSENVVHARWVFILVYKHSG